MPISGIIFGEISFDCYTIRCARLPTSRISLELGSVSKTLKTDGMTEMNSLACQPRTIDDRIAWQFTQPVFERSSERTLTDVVGCDLSPLIFSGANCYKCDSNQALHV